MDKQVSVTIPWQARQDLTMFPGYRVEYVKEENQYTTYYKIQRSIKPVFSLGKKHQDYLISTQGQITVPRYILEDLNIRSKEELAVEFMGEGLILVKSCWQKFHDLLLEIRPHFYEDLDNDTLTIVRRNDPDPGAERFVWVDTGTFKLFRYLHGKLRRLYAQENLWFKIPGVGDIELSLMLRENELVLTKLGYKYLPDPLLSRLWNERVPFEINKNEIRYTENKVLKVQPIHEKSFQELLDIFRRNASKFKYHEKHEESKVEMLELHSGDWVNYHSSNQMIEYWPTLLDSQDK
ncbi:AbrB/MazE/SpoVT family DNA-binding domain-containing protein [Paenibacillus sp. 11B]|uniref:AbrB/MazE/SpoVT family DNA-binding domain-containing protein n=1 Tax=Paenibacillus sp. 11B TaxID=3060965 RepID=UPI002653B293|nr:AbrB/MazE/SpoVT family DNA-binding domain-containing protein [Paenibacillus sp. 11B]MDN8593065.1 AbrB/MazE/SpoVT family DNA-binding domain-containing protein [Paenibacillus sp. 11B]